MSSKYCGNCNHWKQNEKYNYGDDTFISYCDIESDCWESEIDAVLNFNNGCLDHELVGSLELSDEK